MKPPISLFLLIVLLSSAAVLAQDAQHSDPCKAMPAAGSAAAKYFLTFEQFEKELRVDITRQDAVALAFLVKFPLHVSETGGSMISLTNAAALKSHFGEVFTPAVRKQILSRTSDDVDDVDCDEEYISLAGGVIAVIATDRGYAISAVSQNGTVTPETYYICQTQSHRIVVDAVAGGELRYRSWNKPRAVTEAPDLVLTKGESTIEGNRCGDPVYAFKNGATEYRVVGSLNCYPTLEIYAPPKGATGRLEVTVAGKPAADSWCY
jgi:hypothetical protein